MTAEQIEQAAGDVVFAGWREDIPELMALMDVFVLPSWREGLPRSAIEAAASGLPLVLTDIRGCREVVATASRGCWCPCGILAAWPGRSSACWTTPSSGVRMGAAARARAEERFDERRVTATVVQVTQGSLQAAGRLPSRGDRASGPRVRRARTADAVAMARLHADSMPTAFLPTLGRGVPGQAVSRADPGSSRDRDGRRRRTPRSWASRPRSRRWARSTGGSRSGVASSRRSPQRRSSTHRRCVARSKRRDTRPRRTICPTPSCCRSRWTTRAARMAWGVPSCRRSPSGSPWRECATSRRWWARTTPEPTASTSATGSCSPGASAVHEGERSNVWTKRCRS